MSNKSYDSTLSCLVFSFFFIFIFKLIFIFLNFFIFIKYLILNFEIIFKNLIKFLLFWKFDKLEENLI